jgi:branched-chain amino acid transport system substrate-binding protein
MSVRIIRQLLLLVALCIPTATSVIAAEPVDVHVVLEQTGAFAFFGAKQVEALHAIEGLVNSTGGIQGRPVRFVLHDAATNPQVAVQLVTQLKAQNVPAIIGPSLSTDCAAVYPIVAQDGPVLYCFSPVVAPPAGGFAFRAGPSIDVTIPVYVRYFLSRGHKNIALLLGTDPSGTDFNQTLDRTLTRPEFRDVKIVARERFNLADLSVAAQVANIKAAHPDVILTYSNGTPFGTLLHAFYDAGLEVPIFGSGANMNVEQLRQYSAFMPKDLFFSGVEGLVLDKAAPAAVQRQQALMFRTMQAAGLRVQLGHQLTWDPTMIIISALRKLGPNATAQSVHDYIANLRGWAGVQGMYNFAAGDQLGLGQNGAAMFHYLPETSSWELVATSPRR